MKLWISELKLHPVIEQSYFVDLSLFKQTLYRYKVVMGIVETWQLHIILTLLVMNTKW